MVEINANKGLLLKPLGAPPTATKGTLYFDNSASKLKICNTDGSFADIIDPSLTIDVQEHEIEIIELQANATVTPFTHDTMISDTFSDADGYEGSVQVGTTTADYDAVNKKYKNISGVSSGVIAYYRLESDCTSEIDDLDWGLTPHNSPTFVAGKLNNAISLVSASSQYAKRTDCPTTVENIRTIELWVKTPPSVTDDHWFLSFCPGGGYSNGAFTLGITGGLKWFVAKYGIGSAIYELYGPGGSISASTWYHFVIVQGIGGMKVYLNGNLTPLFTDADTTAFGPSWNYCILGARYDSIYTWDGLIDNVIFWDWEFGTSDVTDSFNAGAGREIATGSGIKIIDVSLGTIPGTVTATQLLVNCPNRESGDDVTYKLKNVTQNDDNLALNTMNSLVNLTTNPTGIEIELVPRSLFPTSGVPSCKTYCLKIWKS